MKKFLIGVLIGIALYSSMMICKNNVERKYKDEIEDIKKIERKTEEVKENLAMIVEPFEIEELEVVNEYEISLGYYNMC